MDKENKSNRSQDRETFMNLMTDFAFKRIFGSVCRKHLLIQFLNILFEKEGLHVYDVTYHDKEVLPENEKGKVIKYDVYCTSPEDKEHFIVEMQRVYHPGFEDRAVLYAIRAASGQLRKGQKYELNPVYSIFLVNFHMPELSRKDFHDVRLMDIDTLEIFSNALRLIFVTLAEAKDTWEDCRTKYEKIIFLIKNMHLMDKESNAYKSKEFSDLFDEAALDNMAAEEMVAYSESKLKYEDDLAALDYNFKKGMMQGREEGREEGRMEGVRESASRMLKSGLDPEFVQRISGLPLEEILRLKE
ncbi:MAG: Rpn family recombination-promoting nuclease/putative transposase [Muribaculaceae bacterium]|nr:Rpn family recombination-promoting nuclease/putative transposase [Muribaculaceae bacterium]